MTIKTKWHRMKELLEMDLFSFNGKSDLGNYRSPFDVEGFNKERLVDMVSFFDKTPKFYFDREIYSNTPTKEFLKSMLDMKKAGLLRLPYEEVVIELSDPKNKTHYITILSEIPNKKLGLKEKYSDDGFSVFGWSCQVTDIGGADITGYDDYLLIPYIFLLQGIREKADLPDDPDVLVEALLVDHITVDYKKWGPTIKEVMMHEASIVTISWILMMLLLTTKGVITEEVDVTRLNKKRKSTGKQIIPQHTYVKIGRVYNSDGSSSEYDHRKSPRPHWRRGHLRTVWVGEGRKGKKEVYVGPVLVAAPSDKNIKVKDPSYSVHE